MLTAKIKKTTNAATLASVLLSNAQLPGSEIQVKNK